MGSVAEVSVVITAFNAQRTIARAVASALAQSEVAQVLVIDDGSHDQTSDTAHSADDGSRRLQVIRLIRNRGPSAARNLAFARATAPFLAILDADDFFLPNRFVGLDAEGWDFLADNIAFIPEGSAVPAINGCDDLRRTLTFEEFVDRNISRPEKVRGELGFLKPIIRRDALRDLGLSYDENLRLGEDFILYATAMARGARFDLSARCGYIAEVRASSLSGQHRTEDLVRLSKADERLIAEIRTLPRASDLLPVMRMHLEGLKQKISTRQFLDRKREAGLASAAMTFAARPAHAFSTAREILRARWGAAAPALPPLRLLMEPTEFDMRD